MVNEPPTPAAIQRTFHRHLAAFLKPGDPSLPDSQRGLPSAQEVFSLGLEALSSNDNKFHEKATSVGWRFLIGSRSGNGLYATVSHSDGEAPELAGVSRGPEAAAAVKAKQDVKKLPGAQEENYNLCILAIPGLLTECFWLKWTSPDKKRLDPKQDLIVPFVTAQEKLMPMNAYTMKSFTEKAQPLAAKRLAAFNRLKEEELAGAKERWAATKKKRLVWRGKAGPIERPERGK